MKIFVIDPNVYAVEFDGDGFGPKRPGDAGIDLRTRNAFLVKVGTTAVIPLGVSIALEDDEVGWLTGRSSTAVGDNLLTHEGKIDSGYRGEIHCLCTALTHDVYLDQGDRICQLVVLKISRPTLWEIVGELPTSERGVSGLGSTGRS